MECKEGVFYHAGDLNDWVWEGESVQFNKQMNGNYKHEIDLLKKRKIDHAFLPLDPRQEKYYANGVLYFLKKVTVDTIHPMHYWENPSIIQRFKDEYPEYKNKIAR